MKAVILSAVGFACAMTVFTASGGMAATSGPSTRSRGLIGTVVRVDGNNVIVNALQGRGTTEATVATDANTDFTVNYEPGSKLTDLKPGMQITVTPLPNGRVIISAHSNGLTGTVVSRDGRNIVVRHGSRGGASEEVTVTTNEKTKVFVLDVVVGGTRYSGKTVKVADLQAGMRVSVLPETGTASKIVVMPTWRGREPLPLLTPVPDPVWGTFVRTYGTSMVISAEQKEGPPKEVSVPTDDKTRYLVDGEIAKLADVKPGMRVTTTPLPETPRHPALLTVEASSKGRSGRLVRVDGKNVVLKTASAEAGGEVAVATDENTRCILLAHKEESGLYEPRSCRLSELTAGMPVKALPETGTASKIIAHQLSRWAARPASKPAATAPAESQPSASGRDRIKQRQTERLDKT